MGGAVVAVITLAAIIAFAISSPVVDQLTHEASDKAPVRVGSACTSLLAALESFEDEQDDEGMAAIKDARRLALGSLQKSNDKFGRPEELALRLGADLASPPLSNAERDKIVNDLDAISGTCEDLQG